MGVAVIVTIAAVFFAAFVVLLGIAWGVLPRTEKLKGPPVPPHEVAAAIGVALLLPILLAVTWATTGYFKPRYVIGTSIGSPPTPRAKTIGKMAMIATPSVSSLGRKRCTAPSMTA